MRIMIAATTTTTSILWLLVVSSTTTVSAASPLWVEGDYCNVTSRDFLNANFSSVHTVAGDGCTVVGGGVDGSNNTLSSCYCAPVLNNNESLSDWTWQCGDKVSFGPTNGKTCPAKVPVLPPFDNNINNTVAESALGVGAYCNLTVHPSGRYGDEVCGYSTCEDGGDYSAVCACVDLERVRGIEGAGQQWFCLHSKCGCGEEVEPDQEDKPITSKKPNMGTPVSSSAGPIQILSVAALAVTWWISTV
jgi:hypothetical protein